MNPKLAPKAEVIVHQNHRSMSSWAASVTLFRAMEDYITRGVTTEVLGVVNYHDASEASFVWDHHLANRGDIRRPDQETRRIIANIAARWKQEK